MEQIPPNYIPIVTAADNHYAVPLLVMVFSLLENRASNRPVALYVISNDFSEANQQKLADLMADYPHTHLRFLSLDESYFAHLDTNSDYITSVTYYRFAIPDLFAESVKKVLYLDCDMIVREDISLLWDIDLGEKCCGGVPERFSEMPEKPWSVNHLRKMQVPLDRNYYNVGVLLMNLEKWRKNTISQACIHLMLDYPERISMDDQDAINSILADDWLQLPFRWNIISTWFLDFVQEVLKGQKIYEAALDPAIVHYTSRNKPWKIDSNHFHKGIFKEYWIRYILQFGYDLGPEPGQEQAGVSIISFCEPGKAGFLPKALQNWLEHEVVTEILLLDATGDRQVEDMLLAFPVEKIIHIRVEAESFTTGICLNTALRMSRGKKVLVIDPDCLVYAHFFEDYLLTHPAFGSMYSWRDWYLKVDYFHTCLFVKRQDLIAINGFHEELSADEVLPFAFQQLKQEGLTEIKVHYNSIYCMSSQRTRWEVYDVLPGYSLPPLYEAEKWKIIDLKNDFLTAQRPWNLISQLRPVALKEVKKRQWLLSEGPENQQRKSVFPREELEKEVFKNWLNDFFPESVRYNLWLDKNDPRELSQKIFQPDNLLFLLERPGRIVQYVQNNPQQGEACQKQLEAVYASYSWKIGFAITRIIYKSVSWLPFFKKSAQ